MDPLIVVAGATSKQGRSVVGSLLATGRFRVRALTRDVGSPGAQALARQGAEVVRVPLSTGHFSELVAAFSGADGAFLMTPSVAPPSREEYDLGVELADAAAEAGVGHVVFSTLANVDERTNGALWVPHFTDKALVADHIRSLGLKHTFIALALFYTNALEYYVPQIDGGKVVIPIYLPEDFPAPFVDPLTATGPAVVEIFKDPDRHCGQTLPIIGDVISPREMVATFERVTGLPAVYRDTYSEERLTAAVPRLAHSPLKVKELIGMARFAVEYGYFDPSWDRGWAKNLDLQPSTWEQFLSRTGWTGQAVRFGA